MLRSSAKNHDGVVVLCDPADYESVIGDLKSGDGVSAETRFKLALKVFRHTAAYDAMIAGYLETTLDATAETPDVEATEGTDRLQPTAPEMPAQLTLTFEKIQTLRYGENAHQQGTGWPAPQMQPPGQAMTSTRS